MSHVSPQKKVCVVAAIGGCESFALHGLLTGRHDLLAFAWRTDVRSQSTVFFRFLGRANLGVFLVRQIRYDADEAECTCFRSQTKNFKLNLGMIT